MNLTITFVLFTALCASSKANLGALSPRFIDSINGLRPLWTASSYGLPPDYDAEDLRKMASGSLDLTLPDSEHYALVPTTPYAATKTKIPKEFDARQAWPKCKSITEIRDQGRCGSCWAFAAAEVMSDRLCIRTGTEFQYSPEDLLENCKWCIANASDVCGGGGYKVRAFQFWLSEGIVSGGDANSLKGCKPYNSEAFKLGLDPKSTLSCTNAKYQIPYKTDKHWGKNTFAVMDVSKIQQEIMENGPVSASYVIYTDFYSYSTGIYHHITGSKVGGHSVKLIGWGESADGTPYWLVANSWGVRWGESGFFRILRGKDECGIESRIVAGLPFKNESFFTTWIIEPITNFFKMLFGGIFFY